MTNYILGTQTFTHFADLCNAYFKERGRYPAAPLKSGYLNGIWTVWY